jgi:hypothetical protein
MLAVRNGGRLQRPLIRFGFGSTRCRAVKGIFSNIGYRLFIFKALFKLKVHEIRWRILDAIARWLRRRRRPRGIGYRVDDFLEMENQVKAYYAFCETIRKEDRELTPAELRVLCLPDFLALCCANGFDDLYWQATWAVVPSAELMEAIGEREFAEMLRRCIAIVREFGERIGRDPFNSNSDYVKLDEETEKQFNVPELDFCKQDFDWDELCRKTMDYVRKNRELFIPPNKP